MKFNSRICARCGGSKTITDNWKSHTVPRDCPNCSGEGIEYIISPKVWQEYKELKQATTNGFLLWRREGEVVLPTMDGVGV